jgi:riboflavin synthase
VTEVAAARRTGYIEMFTGIVQATGSIQAITPGRESTVLTIRARSGGGAVRRGESIAVAGVCLTVEETGRGWFQVRAAAETLRRTTLGSLRRSARVNLERSLRLADRLGGHFVFGHVDGIATLKRIRPDGDAMLYTFEVPGHCLRYLVEKGSVTLDGVSLTVFGCARRTFSVSLIPHTLRHTTLGSLRPGARLNLETDMLARYVDGCLRARRHNARSRRRAR